MAEQQTLVTFITFIIFVVFIGISQAQKCNFDTGLCGYTQSKNDTFDWTRNRGSVRASGTGPSKDHTSSLPGFVPFTSGGNSGGARCVFPFTYNGKDVNKCISSFHIRLWCGTTTNYDKDGKWGDCVFSGYYMYIETSAPRRAGDRARLTSPTVKAGSKCLSFWYHMYGPHINTLNVYANSSAGLGGALWSKTGTQGNLWRQQNLTVTSSNDFQIVFEAIRGISYKGAIAIDDVDMKDGTCDGSVPGGALKCTFEKDKCSFVDEKGYKFNWTRAQGRTPSTGTGPIRDHTLGTGKGHFMYIEVSPHKRGDKAGLSTQVNALPSTGSCLFFWYHMFGYGTGSLNVLVNGKRAWSAVGQKGKLWLKARVPLSATSAKIIFEGVVGSTYTGDIAIDDFEIVKGSCYPAGTCDFQNGFCTWYNKATGDNFDWIIGQGSTSSTFTGPSADHTGNKNGKYIFIETSSPRKIGDKARLYSTFFNQTSSSVGSCFTFWYHMYGTSIGTLNIYVSAGSEKLVWRLSGNKGQRWYNGQVNVGYKVGNYQIIVEGVRGRDYTGDIAIDDFKIKTGSCLILPTSADPNLKPSTAAPTTIAPTTKPVGTGGNDCNFELVGCSWKDEAKTDQLNWTRRMGSTPSFQTGPSVDHTKGTKYGYYIYMEVSGAKLNATARLNSPVIPATNAIGGRCLRFWYHMYGPHINSLNVYTKTIYQTVLGTPVWSRTGTQGNKWIEGMVTVTASSRFQIILEGTAGWGYMGDIALDDISVKDGPCPVPSTTCTFEKKDICSYTHDESSAADFKWTRASKNTASIGTGPSTDHTTQSAAGFYMYTEASSRKRGEKARLISPVEPSGQYCLKFWYHMYGADIGSLSVYAKTGNTLPSRPLWAESGNKGNLWRDARFTVKATSAFQIVFEGVVGTGYRSDIAIDDVSLNPGVCPPPGFCNFEKGLCSYVNARSGDNFDWLIGSAGTPSSWTGPATDHTTGTAAGKYLFIEASNLKLRKGYKARLISEQFNTLGAKSRCFSFWYHMYGSNIGSLRIIYKTSTGLKPETLIWNLTGQQQTSSKDPWRYATAPMKMNSDHSIIIEGIYGGGYMGDIAVDDIQVLNQACTVQPPGANPNGQPSPKPTTPFPRTLPTAIPKGQLNCAFEKDICQYVQDSSDKFNWTRVQGYTHSVGTGPRFDHTKGKGAVGPLGPGSLVHAGGKCIHVLNGAWNKPKDDQPLVVYDNCGQDRMEFKIDNGFLKLTRHNMCVRPKGAGTAENTVVGVSDTCGNDKWQFLSTGVLQHIPSKKCLMPKNKYSNPPNNNLLVISSTCTGFYQKFSWTPTLGWYAYIETSAPRKANDAARLISQKVTKANQCLKFWYHMYGPHVNRLHVYLKRGNQTGSPVWSKYGTHGDKWRPGQALMKAQPPFQIVFEAVRGTGYMGDIAIDDIEVLPSCGPPDECTFEETNPPLCGWMNVRGLDNFDWIRQRGHTASVGTGPANDHTYGNSKGYYMYIETSSGRVGWKAQLISRQYPSAAKTNGKCLQFWYHMYGSSIGTLNVYIKAGSSPTGSAVWSKSSNQGNQWNIGQLTISVGLPFTIMLEAVKGRSYTGDIAIDDIRILDGVCNKPAECSFENDRCTWTNIKTGDDFDWTVRAGSTPSSGTGPIADHTKRNGDGKYAFIETSAPRKMGEKARYLSERFVKPNPKVPYCLRFWYHMYGYSVGSLNIIRKTGPGKLGEKVLWSLSGNQGRIRWRAASVPITSLYDFQMIFEGVVGNSTGGDIAIDDITYSATTCSLQPSFAKPMPPTTAPPKTVKPTTPAPGSYKCGFEKDLCTWTQDVLTDTFNWTRHKGKTSSTDTGPSTDHTTSTGNGTYLYIETSLPRKKGDIARLLSQIIPADSKTGGHCLTFWYHMYGPDINALNVKTQQGKQTSGAIWTRVGNNGNRWIQGQVDVKSLVDYKIVFEGVAGSSFNGDISLDDVDVIAGACPPPKTCDFEHGLCDYQNDKSDNFDWTRRKGSTPSIFTGPSTDHTLQTKEGYYLYTEVSLALPKGATARIISSEKKDNKPMCLEFWYHLYGLHIGALNVYVQITSSGITVKNRIWTRAGNHGKTWKVARTTVSGGQGRRIVFEGVRGSSFMGDIAIDDIRLLDGNCPPPGNCNFETGGMCTWTNAKSGDDFDWLLGTGGTTSFYTGPDTDHTLQTASGHYVFIEASAPAKPNFVAWLESEVFTPTGSNGRCLKFWYHMKGSSIGSLNAFVRGQNGTKNKIWNLDGQQGTVWKYGQAPIRSTVDYQVVFEGVRGSSYSGDIALDDIEFTNYACVNLPPSSKPIVPTTKQPPPPSTTKAPTPAPTIWNCNFTFDKCTWTDDPTGHFNWTRHKGSTGSFQTGPSKDHTTESTNGYYIYAETSYPRVPNDTARLISKVVPPTYGMCLQFWYHMYGDHVDNLTVYLKTSSAMTPVFRKGGTQGDRWRHGTIDIVKTTRFQVVFEAIRGKDYRGDIALDDLSLTNGRCPPQAECTFEDPKLCGWRNVHGDNFDWTRASGYTASVGTGPPNDHTYGTKIGYYMYIETSSPRTKGHKAWLQSRDHKPTNGRCLQFWYHMFGSSVGTLNVLLYVNGSRSTPIWSLSGNQGYRWRIAQTTIKSSTTYRIIFEGITGASYTGDIAIDDVYLKDGACPLPGNCNFEQGMCTYSNVNYDNFDWLVGKGGTWSQFTGPKIDHSLGTADGHYAFIETSWPRMPQEKAYLESEVIQAAGTQGKCLNFWYHMYGTHIGTLKVYMYVQGQGWSVLWHLDGEQGNAWMQAQVPVMSRGQNFEVLFEGIRGQDYKGDIAIDDITFTDFQGSCPLQPKKAVPWGCNFELDTCNWKQSFQDNFDWTRSRGTTTSAGTGPSTDHSTGTKSGYYMYIETSAPRKTNDTARLLSPVLKGNGTKLIYCMQFYYHMYGPHVNSLRVYTRQGLKTSPALWERKGTQGPRWRYGEVQFTVVNDMQVMFEGTRGLSYQGDIAIDDIDLEYGDCPSSGICTFEGAYICGWYQDTRDDFDWTRASGATPSVQTGPKFDHTYGTKFGHYMYVETSNSLPAGSVARLYSTYYYNKNKKCVQFFYHMFGQTVNKLNVKISYGYLSYIAFSKTGNQNNTWHLAQVDVNLPFSFLVIFEGIKGQSYTGDIAIDDFKIIDGTCPTPGDCDFEKGDFCTWTNSQNDDFDWLTGNGKTASIFTGPATDHTTNTDTGYYAFIETSLPRKTGDKAAIESIQFPPVSSAGRCIKFWYHMYGSTIGILNVFLRSVGTKKADDLLWQLKGNQGNKWLQGTIPLSSGTAYKVVIEAIRGSSYTGDIALDDIVFTVGSCTFAPGIATPPGKTTPPPTPGPTPSRGPTAGTTGNDCNFEPGFCAWTQNSTATFKWKRHKGITASVGTGPKTDHTMGDGSGYYAYIETSVPAKMNDTARLMSGSVPAVGSSGTCLSFYFHMYGPHVNRLNVKSKVGSKESLIWSRIGTQGDKWRRALIQLPKTASASTVILEGIRGVSYLGDIALDDISFLSGTCPPPSECTFEYTVGGSLTCQWTQDKTNDKFDWTRANKNTPSVTTGPKTDHTLQTAQGYYMYIETSYPRKKGDNAILLSPQYASTKGKCFTYWYHMYGGTIGSLRVLKDVSGKRTALWSKTGNQGNVWRLAFITIKSSVAYKLAFEGVVGSSFTGDIAIDDIRIVDGSCPAPGDCDFETFAMCTYLQDKKEDKFDWLRGSGSTSSWMTGPKIDNTKKTASGHYMYIEASYPQKMGDNARLVSETFSPTGFGGRCVKFAFHMYGSTIGTLNIYVKTGAGNKSESLIWTNSGNHGQQWIMAQAPVVSSVAYTVVFEGVVGRSYAGDIAIDDIAFVNFRCAHIPSNAAPPTVPPTTVTPADSNCTFETGFCRWTQLKGDKFDWTRNKDNTGSVGTGPLGDHTTGKGHYIYVEASAPRRENDTAVIESPTIRPSVSVVCFTFYYHMHGSHVGQLNVYYILGKMRRRLWSRTGTQSNKWRYAQMSVGGYRSFKIQIEGVRGKSYEGDIAIDDIVVQDKRCPPNRFCDFEDLTMCTWMNVRGIDKFDWTRRNDGTPSLGTGPSFDHTTGTKQGSFLYVESSFPRRKGDTAWLYSRYMSSTDGRCFNFWYHMYGSHIGALNVYTVIGSKKTLMWNRTGDQGNVWRHARVSLKSKSSFRVMVEGVIGASYMGDIALDDMSFDDYKCPPPGSCNFEDGLCTWSNVKNINKTGYDDFDWQLGSGSTPSVATGPKVDHTLGNALGTYVFIETSGFNRKAGERALLQSELFGPTNGKCMSYWYHMYGTTIGTLRVWLKNDGGLQLLRTINGSQGNAWKEDEVGLYSRSNFRVLLEGVRGKDYTGDIALDDIYVTDKNCVGLCTSIQPTARVRCGYKGITAGRCTVTLGCCFDDSVPNVPACFFHPSSCSAVPIQGRQQCGSNGINQAQCENLGCCFDPNVPRGGVNCYHSLAATTKFPPTRKPPMTTPAPSIYDCNFESGLCKFTNVKGDQFDWSRKKGATPSVNTGPSGDHTLGNENGHYIYIETSFQKQNATANLVSPMIDFSTGGDKVCVRFWFHMYGAHVDKLNVYLQTGASLPKTPIWTKDGTHGNRWRRAQILVARRPAFKIVFQGTKGPGYQGDIALDDIGFVNGDCPPSYACDFESINNCGYTQDASDDFDWTRASANTTSYATGPPADHTYGTKAGHYLHIEASYPRQPGDVARIETPEHPATFGKCVEFFYHMYGAGMGTLNILLRKGGILDSKPVWSVRGDQGYVWNRATVTVKTSQTWKMVFEGIRGKDYRSDIAIDDITIRDGECPPKGSCDFEDGLCAYDNIKDDNFDWLRHSGGTPSIQTGPKKDHTLNSSLGHYMYIETSFPRKTGDIANFLSEKFTVNPQFKWCVSFWYHMYGSSTGALKVGYRYKSIYSKRFYYSFRWSQSGNHGDQWHFAQAPIVASTDFQIAFQASVGSTPTYNGDIAIDDINVVPGKCPAPTPAPTPNPCAVKCKSGACIPADRVCNFIQDCGQNDDSDEKHCGGCDFESGLCKWTDASQGAYDWNRQNGGTATPNTGPSTDHTKGNALGYYAYVESSTGSTFDLAQLKSPLLQQAAAPCQIQFWYHMYGSSIGTLKVYVITGTRHTLLWTKSGNQGNKWIQAVVYVMRRKVPYRILLESERSYGSRGDIAIDDISLVNCALPTAAKYCWSFLFRCAKTRACISRTWRCDYQDDCGDNSDEENCYYDQFVYRCNFEYSMCQWRQMKDDQFDWTRARGITGSLGTGPLFDHTTGTGSGYYIYAEASYPRKKGDKARIQSGNFMPTQYSCYIRFFYHMYGDDIGLLNVYTRTCIGPTCPAKLVWSQNGTVGNFWVRKAIGVRSTKPFQFIIEAVRGDNFAGDIALDDITFYRCQSFYKPLPTGAPTTTMKPTTPPCPSGKFFCSGDPKCIDRDQYCDFVKNCKDGSDESNCGPCDFESSTCGYTDASIGKYAWGRAKYPADQTGKGPSKDHTKGTDGYYMYVKTGSGTQKLPAKLISKGLGQTGPNCVVQVYWSSNVTYFADFKVGFIERKIESLSFGARGYTAGKWKVAQAGLGARRAGWQLFITADDPYLAIDDITFVNCSLPPKRGGQCGKFESSCSNGRCITMNKRCDFANDCGDYSDEIYTKECVNYKQRCNFERDICDWYQNADDNFDWTRKQGSTVSLNSGPGNDHTRGTRLGYYLYIEASFPRRVNDTAKLSSVVFKPVSLVDKCVMRFFYHMYGEHINQLNVYTVTSSAPGAGMTKQWSKTGSQGDIWLRAEIPLKSSDNFKIVIEGVRGKSYAGDIAIDDISFTPGCKPDYAATLNPDPMTPSPPPNCKAGQFGCKDGKCIDAHLVCNFKKDCSDGSDEATCPSACDFENGVCGWSNPPTGDRLDWARHQGQTPSNGTGPSTDHTKKTKYGYYVYMEAGQFPSGRFPNAHFLSPLYYQGARSCKFTFWYNMWHVKGGADVKLGVLFRRSGKDTELWSTYASTGNAWKQKSITLPACSRDFQVVFEGLHHWSTKTDVAIDDVKFVCSEAAPPATCKAGFFQCAKTKQCVAQDTLCDYDRNCCDGSDENEAACKGYSGNNFEAGYGDWVQLSTDDFDWTLTSGVTQSVGTGPKRDHTLGEEHGKYIFIEASSPRKQNQTSQLASPTIAGSGTRVRRAAGDCTLRVFYHMFGRGTGNLNVYTATTYGKPEKKVFSISGDQGDEWKRAVVPLKSTADFQVIIEGTIGSSFSGDIALDDISFTPGCNFNGALLPGAPTPPPVDPCHPNFLCRKEQKCISRRHVCDFHSECVDGSDEASSICGNPCGFEKNEGFCGWKNSHKDDYDWQIHKGNTPSVGTGPKEDATGNVSRQFLYFEVSQRRIDKKAIIISPVYGGSFADCIFKFNYHMYGSQVGTLNLELQESNSTEVTTLWQLTGYQSRSWQEALVSIGRRLKPFNLYLNGTVGSGYRGDLGLDEFKFYNCSPPEQCADATGKFICTNGACVDETKVCDLTDDCGDASDENIQLCSGYIGCSFETTPDPCNFTDAKDDDFDWTRHQGSTFSVNTGPSRDHTYGTSLGWYKYMETSSRRYKQTARLVSIKFKALKNGNCQMRIFYHMFGRHVKDFNIYVKREGSTTLITKFSASGNQGDVWKKAIIDLSKETETFVVIIEGVRGISYIGDIAIDDITFTPDCITNGSRPVFPTVIPTCDPGFFQCRSDKFCIPQKNVCDKTADCHDGSDEANCDGGKTGKQTGNSLGANSGIVAAIVVGVIVVLLVIILVAYIVVKRKREKKLHLFSVFYDPTKQQDGNASNAKSVAIKDQGGVTNPVYDERPIGDYAMGELDNNMFSDDTFNVPTETKGGATSMANPLYQDPYIEYDNSPLSEF